MDNKKTPFNKDISLNSDIFQGLNRQQSDLEFTRQVQKRHKKNSSFHKPEHREQSPTKASNLLKNNQSFHSRRGKEDNKSKGFKKMEVKRFKEPTILPIDKELEEVDLSRGERFPLTINHPKTPPTIQGYIPQTINKDKSIFDENPLEPLKRFQSFDQFAHLALINKQSANIIADNMREESAGQRSSSFGNLCLLLKKHFKGEDIEDPDLNISKEELAILKAIVNRKYKNKFDLKNHLIFLKDKLMEISKLESKKRPEENYKFIFKRCIKYLKEALKTSKGKKMSKKDFNDYFYKYYFEAAAKKENLSIDLFKHPQNRNKKDNFPKTINIEYISYLKKSDLFLDDLYKYLDDKLMDEYKEIIDSKIDGLFKKWEDQYTKEGSSPESLDKIVNYISTNTKCKLPWTSSEIDEATNSIRRILEDE